MKSIRNSKGLYWGLIITFFILYFLVGFVSTLHSITFFQLANVVWMAVLLGITYEVGQAAVLFSILMSDNNKKLLPWLLMFLLTALQITANVYASFKFMDGSGSNDWTYWQRSILFWLEADGPEMFKVVISWITGALLPIVALGMTALVAENLKLKDEQDKEKEPELVKVEPPITPEPSSEDKFYDKAAEQLAKDIDKEIIQDIVNERGTNHIIENVEIKPEEPKPVINKEEHLSELAKHLLENQLKSDPSESKVKEGEGGVLEVEAPFVVDIPTKNLFEDGDYKTEDEWMDLLDLQDQLEKEEPTLEEVANNPRGRKIEKKPNVTSRGWHLKKLYVDDNGDVYHYGIFSPDEHAEIPPEIKPEEPKKA